MDKYISTNALIEELKRRDFLPVIVKQAIEAVPAADVAPVRHGRWLEDGTCSKCRCDIPVMEDKYCPNCGAKMDGDTP